MIYPGTMFHHLHALLLVECNRPSTSHLQSDSPKNFRWLLCRRNLNSSPTVTPNHCSAVQSLWTLVKSRWAFLYRAVNLRFPVFDQKVQLLSLFQVVEEEIPIPYLNYVSAFVVKSCGHAALLSAPWLRPVSLSSSSFILGYKGHSHSWFHLDPWYSHVLLS